MGSDNIQILYEDEVLVAVNKPPGMVVHRAAGRSGRGGACVQRVRNVVGCHVHPAHRLDRKTTGVLVFAKSPEAAAELARSFRERETEKHYVAIVRGWLLEGGVESSPLTDPETEKEQEAETRYRPLATVELPIPVGPFATARYSLVAATPTTGRWHQIRRHLRRLNHPVIGDTTHGEGRQNRLFREHLNCHTMLLHASALRIPHPETGEILTLEARPPGSFRRVCNRLGWPEQPDVLTPVNDT